MTKWRFTERGLSVVMNVPESFSITVRPVDGGWELVSGERRLLAVKRLHRDGDVDDT